MSNSKEEHSMKRAKKFEDALMVQRNILFSVLAGMTIVVGEIIYFYEIFFEGKTLGLGSDGLLINLMLEHWHDVFQGELSFETLRMFYPQMETLGYSDMLLGPGVIFSLIRVWGADIFTSMNIALILLHGIGVCFLYFSLRKLGASRKVGILGILISFWSCSYSQLTWHLQFFSLSYISIALFGMTLYKKNANKGIRQRFIYLLIITCGMGGAFLSSFYTAYVTCLLIILTVVFLGLRWIVQKKSGIPDLLKCFYKYRWDCIAGVMIQIPWLIVFFRVYLAAYKQLGTYDPETTLFMAPSPTDLFRTMSYAPIESRIRSILPFQIDNKYQSYAENAWFERSCGWPVIVVMLLLAFLIFMFVNKKAAKKKDLILYQYIAISMLLIFFLGARYGTFCPWAHVLVKIIPGAAAIRVTGRSLGILVIPLALCICGWISELETIAKQNKKIIVLVEMLLFFVLGVTALSKRYIRDDSENFSQIVNRCKQPPKDCEAILIYSLSPETVYGPEMQLVAWMIADRFDVYSINGYTGNYPEYWRLVYNNQYEYLNAVEYWLDKKDMTDRTGIYAYIMEADIWISYPDLHEFAIMNHILESS